MAGRRTFAELRARMTPEARRQSEVEALRLQEEMGLAEYRRLLKLSQEELGRSLDIGQGAVAKIEQRSDMRISTLRRYIEALGGELEILARFPGHPDQVIKIGGRVESSKEGAAGSGASS